MALRRMSIYLLIPVLCVYLYAGLKGIFSTHNPLSLSDQRGELVFARGSRAHTEPLFNLDPASNIQIDLRFEYHLENLDRGGVIAVVDGPSAGGELILWQWKNQLVLMSGDDYNARLRKPRVWVDLPKDNVGPYDVSARATPTSLSLTVTGDSFSQVKSINKSIEFDTENIRVVLGTNKSHRFPWVGKIHYVALKSDTENTAGFLNRSEPVFAFDETKLRASEVDEQGYVESFGHSKVNLYVGTKHLKVESRSLQSIKNRLQLPNISPGDLLLNFVGFFPLGILVFIIFSARGYWFAGACTVAASFLLSSGIELMQLTIPFRDPSQMDLLLNTLGGGFGGFIAWCLLILYCRITASGKLRRSVT